MILDRTISPVSYKMKKQNFFVPKKFCSKKGIDIFLVSFGSQEIVKIEFFFESGIWYEKKNGESYFSSILIQEGSKNKNQNDIADFFDFHGAFFSVKNGVDYTSVSISCLVKFVEKILNFFFEMINSLDPKEDRLIHLKDLEVQKIKIRNAEIDFVSKKNLKKLIYGQNHPYGKFLDKKDIDEITFEDVKNFCQNNLFVNPKIFISGLLDEKTLNSILDKIENLNFEKKIDNNIYHTFKHIPTSETLSIKSDSLQSAISLGKELPKKNHEDFIKINFVNIVLGGYFGSKLMKNIRETNGYTYGIHSSIYSYKHSSYFKISAEIARGFENQTFDQIDIEIENLKKEEISSEELKNIKSYIIGTMKINMENPIVIMNKFKNVNLYDLDISYFDDFYDTVFSISANDICSIAKKYFDRKDLSTVSVN